VLSFFSWNGQQQYSSSQPVFVFTTIGLVTGPLSPLVDVGSGEANADADHRSVGGIPPYARRPRSSYYGGISVVTATSPVRPPL
jgi:hypothetical protein